MAQGRLAVAVSVAGSDVDVYQVPGSGVLFTTASINIVNRGSVVSTVRVAISLTATPGLSEYIEYDMEIPPKGIFERGFKLMSPGEHIVVHSDSDDLSIRIEGLEKSST